MNNPEQVTVPYCTKCKTICLEYTQSVVRYGVATIFLNDEGYEDESDYDWNDSESFEMYCSACGEELQQHVNLDYNLFRTIKKQLAGKTTLYVDIPIKEGERLETVPAEQIKDLIFEGLV